MKVSVAIMAMKERQPYVEELAASLDAPAQVIWDTRRDRYDTGRRALRAYAPDATHHLVLQDDAVVCRDLVASLDRAVRVIPNNPLSLYFGYGRNGAHQRTNSLARSSPVPSLLVFEGPWWGVAVCFPVKLIERMLANSDRPQASPAYDKRLSRSLGRLGIDTYYLLPSLVDHRLDGPSMIEGRDQDDRHAHHFIGKDASALDIEWASLPVIDGHNRSRITRTPRNLDPPAGAPLRGLVPRPSKVSEVKLSVSVMAHPKRRDMAEDVASEVDATVVYDERNDRWDTGARAWQAHDPTATHHLVLQDDCIPSEGILESLSDALGVVGDNPVGLYVGTVRPASQFMGAMVAHAEATGASWVVGEGPWWGVAVCLPVSMIGPMLDWCAAHPQTKAYDRRMANHFKAAGIDCWYTMPSLVDHRTDTPSLVQTARGTGRKARRFAADARGIDWTRLPHTTGEVYVTYTAAGSRRFYRCLCCGYYTPRRPAIRRHAEQCVAALARTIAPVAVASEP